MLAKSFQRKRAHTQAYASPRSKITQISLKLLKIELLSSCQILSSFNFKQIWVNLDQRAASIVPDENNPARISQLSKFYTVKREYPKVGCPHSESCNDCR